MASPFYTPSGVPVQGADGASADIRTEFGLIETGIDTLNLNALSAYMPDMNTAGSIYVVVPFSCQVTLIQGVLHATNSVADTTITFEIGGTPIVMDASGDMVFEDTATVAAIQTATPVSANQIANGGLLEIVTDGAGTNTVPVHFTITIQRLA